MYLIINSTVILEIKIEHRGQRDSNEGRALALHEVNLSLTTCIPSDPKRMVTSDPVLRARRNLSTSGCPDVVRARGNEKEGERERV